MKSTPVKIVISLLVCCTATAGAQTLPDDVHWDEPFGIAGANGTVYTLVMDGDFLYAGGKFTGLGGEHGYGGVACYRIGRWDGQTWQALGPGPGIPGIVDNENSSISGILVYDGIVYVGGYIPPSSGIPWNHVARWDGSQWSQLGSGLADLITTPPVGDIVEFQGDVYFSGGFREAGGKSVYSIARWDGSQWHDLDGGLRPNPGSPQGRAMVTDDNYLYVVGNFAWGDIVNIARWDGNTWSALPAFRPGDYRDMVMVGSDLYVAGLFSTNGVDGTVNNIGLWDGANWHNLGGGANGKVMSIFPVGGLLYIAGIFTSAGGSPANRVAVWDGTNWRGLGSGVGSEGWTFAVAARENGEVFVGGSHLTAGGMYSYRLARWFNPVPYPTAPVPHDGAVIRPSAVALDWDVTGPPGPVDTWDVYLGTTPDPPLVASGLTVPGYTPDNIYNDTQYYWKVVGRDTSGHFATGNVWSFTTEKSWLHVSSDSVYCGPGPDTLCVIISVEDCDLPIDAAGVDITYDPSVLTYLHCGRGDLTQGWQYFDCADLGTSIRWGGFDLSAVPPGSWGALAELYFLVDCSAVDSTVSMNLVPVNLVDDLAQLHGKSGVCTFVYNGATGAGDATPRYDRFVLHQNHPNPFNPDTEIRYEVPDFAGRTRVTISIYDVRGKLVKRLEDGERDPGPYSVRWNGLSQAGESVSSGVYFYVLRAGRAALSRKLVLLR
jgi:hypothetical protein